MYECYNCNIILNESNKSEEHIIPDALGGRIKSYYLLCRDCNSNYGSTIDRELIGQVSVFANLLGIKRDRDKEIKVELKTKSGQTHHYGPNLKPYSKVYLDLSGRKEKIVLFSKNNEEALKLIERKKAELKKKVSANYNHTEFIEAPSKEPHYFSNNLSREVGELGFGGIDFFRAICKIAVNYSLNHGLEKNDMLEAIEFMKGHVSENYTAHFYYPSHYKIHTLLPNEVSHLIYLRGDTKNNILYCYIELFNTENIMVVLNKNYQGEEIEEYYCYDLLNNHQILNKKIDIKLHRLHLLDILRLSQNPKMLGEHISRVNRLTKIIEGRQFIK